MHRAGHAAGSGSSPPEIRRKSCPWAMHSLHKASSSSQWDSTHWKAKGRWYRPAGGGSGFGESLRTSPASSCWGSRSFSAGAPQVLDGGQGVPLQPEGGFPVSSRPVEQNSRVSPLEELLFWIGIFPHPPGAGIVRLHLPGDLDLKIPKTPLFSGLSSRRSRPEGGGWVSTGRTVAALRTSSRAAARKIPSSVGSSKGHSLHRYSSKARMPQDHQRLIGQAPCAFFFLSYRFPSFETKRNAQERNVSSCASFRLCFPCKNSQSSKKALGPPKASKPVKVDPVSSGSSTGAGSASLFWGPPSSARRCTRFRPG